MYVNEKLFNCMKQLWYIRFTLANTSHLAEKNVDCFVGKKSIWEKVLTQKFVYELSSKHSSYLFYFKEHI